MKKKAGLRARRAAAVGTGIAAAVAGGVLAGSGWAFDKAFRPKGDRAVKPDVVPDGPQYAPYADQIRRSVENAAKKPFEPVEILSGDGLYLFGRYYPGEGVWNGSRNSSKSSVPPGTKDLQKRPLALFFHGYRSPALRDGCGGFSLVQEMGYDLIMVDQRGHGGSEGNAITLGVREQYDCLDWIRYCVDRFGPDKPLILIGLSMGASTVLLASGHSLPACVKGVIADCGYSSAEKMIRQQVVRMGLPEKPGWRLVQLGAKIYGGFDPKDGEVCRALLHCSIPALLIHGQEDRFVPCEMSMENFDAIPGEKELMIVPGAGHGMSWYLDQEGYRKAVKTFCRKILA